MLKQLSYFPIYKPATLTSMFSPSLVAIVCAEARFSFMLIDLSDRAKLRVTGPDRIRFLNGQLTNDLTKPEPGLSVYTCARSAKGKLCGDLFVTPLKDDLLLDYEAALRHSIPSPLEKDLIAAET